MSRGARWTKLPPGVKVAGTTRAPKLKLPAPEQGMLALAKPKSRPFTPRVARVSEQMVQRATVSHLNQQMLNGGVFHIPNEQKLIDLLPEDWQRAVHLKGLIDDGMVPGFPDLLGMWRFPARWVAILQAAGEVMPKIIPGLCAAPEMKEPGWKPDKAWYAGKQPGAHAWLRRCGVPVTVCTDWSHVREFFEDCGAPMRSRIVTPRGAALGPPKPPQPVAEAVRKRKAKLQRQRRALAAHMETPRRGSAGGAPVKTDANKERAHVPQKRHPAQAK
jgi:hypothetical protein